MDIIHILPEFRDKVEKMKKLDVAEQLFVEKGFDQASTNDIINKIVIARGTLYYYFSSEEEIFDAIVDRMGREKIAQAAAIIADQEISLLERLTASVLALNVDSGVGVEMLAQMHKSQNALLHQKMQESMIRGVVPLFAKLIVEGK